jgi:hypothetical protein
MERKVAYRGNRENGKWHVREKGRYMFTLQRDVPWENYKRAQYPSRSP